MKTIAKSLVSSLPFIGKRYKNYQNFYKNSCFEAGHYYSPIVSVDDIKSRETTIWKDRAVDGIAGINLRTEEQLKLLQELSGYYGEMPFKDTKQAGLRFYFLNDLYTQTDGTILYSMLRHFQPKRVIEAGSGFTSALMLDVNEKFFNRKIELTFIEPYPERLYTLMTEEDKKNATVIEDKIESLRVDFFKQLQKNDILFIDSTHISKCGSDVNYTLFNILPVLNSGVLIHIHDVFYPFEYPKKWVMEGRNWNEDYLLRAFLMHNNEYEIIHFSDYLQTHYKEHFASMPETQKANGQNIWLRKK